MTRQSTALVLVALLAGCDEGAPVSGGMDGGMIESAVASVSGFVWDPEAFWWTTAMCGQDCPFPPLTVPFVPSMIRSLINGSQVVLIDPATGMPASVAPELTTPNGDWHMNQVPSRPDPPFFMLAAPPAMGTDPVPNKSFGPPIPAAPDANYLPTLVLKPVVTRWTDCTFQSAPLASDAGILSALALYLTSQGTPTQVTDFIDPMKYGGVVITWMFIPGPPVLRVPAQGTQVTADAGTMYPIAWAPPGLGPPGLQSPRGFFVGATGGIGASVLLLPPAMGPTPVNFTFSDPVTDEASGRPWQFPSVPTIPVLPGVVLFNELPGLQPGSPPPPPWVCLGNI